MNAFLPQAAAYHERTKHHFRRYARSRGYLDWATQPNPFRRFAGATEYPLPRPDETLSGRDSPAYDRLFDRPPLPPRVVSAESLGEFLRYSLSITAWKSFRGNTWALRANPSSGNLHPTEGYLILGGGSFDASPAVYHYAPREHALELRARFAAQVWTELTAGLPREAFFVGLSSIHWREAWKYGERAFRYCQHDVGHALAALRLAAATLGWRLRLVDGLSDEKLGRLLGLDRAADFPVAEERERPELLAVVFPHDVDSPSGCLTLADQAVQQIASGEWFGRANRLSPQHDPWPVIDEVSRATHKPETEHVRRGESLPHGPASPPREALAATLFLQRRSAVSFDARTSIARDDFYRLLDRLLPRDDLPPWDAITWPPCVHLGLFVHRVDGLAPGQYVLVRQPAAREELRAAMRSEFAWRSPPDCPPSLPLYCLREADCREAAMQVSCHQDIAGDGAFSLGMLADWRVAAEFGEWFYPRMFWETGVIGQMLYLEAEALGVRGTGIGCFFDEPVHELFGLRDGRFQSLYHFTVGGPIEDVRLTTLPAYVV